MDKAREWMEKAAKAEGCERWKYVGIASHYFFDAKCVWHQVTNEDYYGCHKPFEDEVGEKVKRYGLSGWTVCKCGVCVSASNFRAWLEEFYAFADSYLQPAPAPTPASTPTPTPTPAPTPAPAPTPTPAPTTPLPADTPEKKSPRTPGFEAAAALIALAAGLALRRLH